jgi:hypothetical protein
MINKITNTELGIILNVPVLFSHKGEPIFPTIRITGVKDEKLFGDIFAEETIYRNGGGRVRLQLFSIPFGWMKSVFSNEGFNLPSLEDTIGNWEMILATDTVSVVESETEPMAVDSKGEERTYKELFLIPKLKCDIVEQKIGNDILLRSVPKLDWGGIELPIGLNPLLKWDKPQEKVRISRKEKELIMSFHTRKQKCWICDKFLDNIREDDQGYYITEDVFEDDGIIEHLEQILQRKLDL